MELKKDRYLFDYLSQGQRDLLNEGEYLMNTVLQGGKYSFKDYSFLVFPFAKAYEGFLKQIFMEVGFITKYDYNSDHFRLGKVLSPHLQNRLGNRSVFKKICDYAGCELSDLIWQTWKIGRNQVFHYFPHNLRSLSLTQAEEIIYQVMMSMESVLTKLKIEKLKQRLIEKDLGHNVSPV
jgi:hypothetical protein